MWVSRHPMTTSQYKILSKHDILSIQGHVPTADYLYEKYVEPKLKEYDKIYLVPILPESVKMRILDLNAVKGLTDRVFVLEPIMEEIYKSMDIQDCARVRNECKEDCIINNYIVECKVYKFKGFRRLVRYVKEYAEIEL